MFKNKKKTDVSNGSGAGNGKGRGGSGAGKSKAIANPYFDYRNQWTTREAAARSRERIWQIVALLCGATALLAIAGLVYYGNNSKYIPYVVEVDKVGAALGVRPADKAARADVRVVRAAIASFINDSRMVTPDINVQKQAIFRLYALLNLNDPALGKMTEYINGNEESNPFKRAEKISVETEIRSIIPQSESSWEIDWMETIRERNGVTRERYPMRAIVSYYLAPVNYTQTAESMLYNPLALFVRDFHWSRVMVKEDTP